VEPELIEAALGLELRDGELVADTVDGEACVFLAGLYRSEQSIAERIGQLSRRHPPWPAIDADRAIPWVEGRTGLALAPSQATALRRAVAAKVPVIRLTEVFRQAAASRIITSAHYINRGQMPELAAAEGSDFFFVPAEEPEDAVRKLLAVVSTRIPARFELDPVRDVQVLCPMNRGGLGARALNIELQRMLNPPGPERVERFGWTFGPGDKVMQVASDYERDVFNGDLGIVIAIDTAEGALTVSFDGRAVEYGFGELNELVLAYATTIHKAQGSEYPAVVIPLATQHYVMLARNLLYTGVTRGKQLVVIVGQPKALAMAVRNNGARRRWTKLCECLRPSQRGQPSSRHSGPAPRQDGERFSGSGLNDRFKA